MRYDDVSLRCCYQLVKIISDDELVCCALAMTSQVVAGSISRREARDNYSMSLPQLSP